MADNQIDGLLNSAIKAARNGDRAAARSLLREIVARDDRNESAWLWLAAVAETVEERRSHLERALEINPRNARIQQALAELPSRAPVKVAPTQPRKPAPTVDPRAPRLDQQAEIIEGRRRGFDWTALAIPAGIVLVAFGLFAAVFFPTLDAPTPTANANRFPVKGSGTAAPTKPIGTARSTSTLSFIAQQQTQDAGPSTRTVIITNVPTPSGPNILTFTPVPSVTPPATHTATPTPFPLGTLRLVFAGEGRNREQIGLYRIRGDGQSEIVISADPARAFDPAISPDGKKLVYITDVNGREQLAVSSLDGSGSQIISQFTGTRVRTPAWSPDGKQIAVVSNQSGLDQIYILGSDGSAPRTLSNSNMENRDPSWSPDGKKIVYAGDTTGRGTFQIFVIGVDGNDPVQLTQTQNISYKPAWSPDGTQIAFVSTQDGHANIYTMTADGQDEQILTLDDGNAENRDPSWSPDSRWIVFSSNRGSASTYNLYIMAANGANVSQVTNSDRISVAPHFIPEAK